MPVLPVDRVVDKKRMIGKLEGRGAGEAQGVADQKKVFGLCGFLRTYFAYTLESFASPIEAVEMGFLSAVPLQRQKSPKKFVLLHYVWQTDLIGLDGHWHLSWGGFCESPFWLRFAQVIGTNFHPYGIVGHFF
jgi:hypothetical protein